MSTQSTAAAALEADPAPAPSPAPEVRLERRIGLSQAMATNILAMVGIGPFLTIPDMIRGMGGPHILYPWLFGAAIALCDGLVYAHFGAALPGSGGAFLYLRESYKPLGLGRMMSFTYNFQSLLVTPLSIASGAVGFANYLGYFVKLSSLQHHLIAASLCVAITALLLRNTESIGRLSFAMLTVALGTLAWVIIAGLATASFSQAFDYPPQALTPSVPLLSSTGAVALLAIYNYGGYNTVCNIAEELKDPTRNLPRAIIGSIALVAVIYIVMSTVMIGLIPWQEAQTSQTIASTFIERTFSNPASGRIGAMVMNTLLLFITASSLYTIVLGNSRVVFAAARDGQFFSAFAKLHPTKKYPYVAVIAIGLASLPFCFFSVGDLINWLILVQIAVQFVWQNIGVILFAKLRKDVPQPFRMWLFPLPALVSLTLWCYVFYSAPMAGKLFAIAFLALAVAAYAVFRKFSVRERQAA